MWVIVGFLQYKLCIQVNLWSNKTDHDLLYSYFSCLIHTSEIVNQVCRGTDIQLHMEYLFKVAFNKMLRVSLMSND